MIMWALWGFPGGSDGKESSGSRTDAYMIPEPGRSPGEASGYPLQYSCLENSMNRGALWATVLGATKSRTQLSNWSFYTLENNIRKLLEQRKCWADGLDCCFHACRHLLKLSNFNNYQCTKYQCTMIKLYIFNSLSLLWINHFLKLFWNRS